MLADVPVLVEYSIINPTFIGFEESCRYWSVQIFFCFQLVIINRQGSYDSGILQDYENIRGLPMTHTRFAK